MNIIYKLYTSNMNIIYKLYNQNHNKRIVIIGDTNVGKTSLLRRLTMGDFVQTTYTLLVKIYHVKRNNIIYDLLDYTGYEDNLSGMDGVIIMFDLTSKNTWVNLSNNINKVKSFFNNTQILICGNKSDSNKKKINPKTIKNYCNYINIPYCEISVKNNINCDNILNYF